MAKVRINSELYKVNQNKMSYSPKRKPQLVMSCGFLSLVKLKELSLSLLLLDSQFTTVVATLRAYCVVDVESTTI